MAMSGTEKVICKPLLCPKYEDQLSADLYRLAFATA
jgi:hypothetical protein